MSTTSDVTPKDAAATPQGPQNYAERRLLEIAKAADHIAFWVRLWSILSVVAFVLYLIVSATSRA